MEKIEKTKVNQATEFLGLKIQVFISSSVSLLDVKESVTK